MVAPDAGRAELASAPEEPVLEPPEEPVLPLEAVGEAAAGVGVAMEPPTGAAAPLPDGPAAGAWVPEAADPQDAGTWAWLSPILDATHSGATDEAAGAL